MNPLNDVAIRQEDLENAEDLVTHAEKRGWGEQDLIVACILVLEAYGVQYGNGLDLEETTDEEELQGAPPGEPIQ